MTAAQRQEFEAHLATCADCQAEVAAVLKARTAAEPEAPQARPAGPARRIWAIMIGAVLVLAIGYVLGWWAWGFAHG